MKKTIEREVIFYGKDGKPVAKETKIRYDSGESGFFVEYMVGGKWQFTAKGVSDEVRAMVRDYRDSRVAANMNEERDKALRALLNDAIAKEILAVLCAQNVSGRMHFVALAMSDAIAKRLGGDETARKFFSPRRIGKTIMKFEREFSTFFRWTRGMDNGLTCYKFMGLTQAAAGGVR